MVSYFSSSKMENHFVWLKCQQLGALIFRLFFNVKFKTLKVGNPCLEEFLTCCETDTAPSLINSFCRMLGAIRRLKWKQNYVFSGVNFINVKGTNVVISSYVWLGAKNLYEKCARKTLMKLTPDKWSFLKFLIGGNFLLMI